MNGIDFAKYKRAFLFGCSFTHYIWPTWADLIAKEIPDTHIYAKSGAGNFYIYQAVIEAIVTHKITQDDLVLVMFSNVTREDRYTRREGWITPGNLFFQDTYDSKFMDKFFCEKGYLMRDLALVEGIDRTLSTTGADYSLLSMIPLDSLSSDETKMVDVDDVLAAYESTLAKVKPSVFETIYNSKWSNRQPRPQYTTHWATGAYVDNHPTPDEHLEYIMRTFPATKFKDTTIEYAHNSTQLLFNLKSYKDIVEAFPLPTAKRL